LEGIDLCHVFCLLETKAHASLTACAVLHTEELRWHVQDLAVCPGLAKFAACESCTLLAQEVGYVRACFHASSSNTSSRTLAQLGHATESAVLLFKGLVEQGGAELCESALDVAAAQATSGRCTLKQSLFALALESLEGFSALNALDGCAFFLWATQTQEGLLLLQCWNTCFCVGFEQGLQGVKLPALLCNALACCASLNVGCVFCCVGLHHAANDLCSAHD
jgi:hypothetical protein